VRIIGRLGQEPAAHAPAPGRVAAARALLAAGADGVQLELRAAPPADSAGSAGLDGVLALLAGDGRLLLDIDGVPGRPAAIASAVVQAARRCARPEAVVVCSASGAVLAALRARDPELRRALVTGPRVQLALALHRVAAGGHHDLHPHVNAVLADHLAAEAAAASGLTLRVWGVTRPVDARLLGVVGVTDVITDRPGLLRAGRHRATVRPGA
jgi:glycerophosphoryl diester phosphodiesterase